jgi:hypothetical protein
MSQNSESQTQKSILAQRARDRGLVLTLTEMMEPPLGAEYRRTADDLRKDGWIIIVEQNRKEPSKNRWKFIPPGEPKGKKQNHREEYEALCKEYAEAPTDKKFEIFADAATKCQKITGKGTR